MATTVPSLTRALYDACLQGNEAEVRSILSRNLNSIENETEGGQTALHAAAATGNTAIVKILLDHGANASANSEAGETPLSMACAGNHLETVQLLIERHANKEVNNVSGLSPLHAAFENGSINVAEYLMSHVNLPINLKGRNGVTPLHIACQNNQEQMVRYILDKDWQCIEAVTEDEGLTPLHLACRFGSYEAAKVILVDFITLGIIKNQPNADNYVNSVSKTGLTPLLEAALNDNRNIIELLLTANADPKMPHADPKNEFFGFNALHICCAKNYKNSAREFLRRVDLLACTEMMRQRTALHIAAENDHFELVTLLIQTCNDASLSDIIDRFDSEGYTALHYACKNGSTRVTNVFIQNGADRNASKGPNQSPLSVAIKYDHLKVARTLLDNQATAILGEPKSVEMVGLLCKHGANVDEVQGNNLNALERASQGGLIDVVKALLDYRKDGKQVISGKSKALRLAAQTGRVDIVELLISNGASMDLEDNETPLHLASRNGHVDVVKLLLNKGAAINCELSDKSTALHDAAEQGRDQVVKLLLESGAEVNRTTIRGRTALHLAANEGHVIIADFLLDHGAILSISDEEELTALQLAAQKGHGVVLMLLNRYETKIIAAKEDAATAEAAKTASAADAAATADAKAAAAKEATDKKEIVKVLEENYDQDKSKALRLASVTGKLESVDLLLEKGAKVNEVGKYCPAFSSTPLHLASLNGHDKLVKSLLDKQANPNAEVDMTVDSEEHVKCTALHLAAREGHAEVARLLLDKGADLNKVLEKKLTAVNAANTFGKEEVSALLLNPATAKDEAGNEKPTALHLAVTYNKKSVVKLLLERGANVKTQYVISCTPLQLASIRGFEDIVEELLYHLAKQPEAGK